MPVSMRCSSATRAGSRCKRACAAGRKRCGLHAPKSARTKRHRARADGHKRAREDSDEDGDDFIDDDGVDDADYAHLEDADAPDALYEYDAPDAIAIRDPRLPRHIDDVREDYRALLREHNTPTAEESKRRRANEKRQKTVDANKFAEWQATKGPPSNGTWA
eukprot:jgi/Mesvir1/14646/Mv05316-RA.1